MVSRMCRRSNDECRAVVIPKGTVYEDGEKSQRATVDGALFVVDAKGGARITNVPSDYEPVHAGAKIISYADVVRCVQIMRMKEARESRREEAREKQEERMIVRDFMKHMR